MIKLAFTALLTVALFIGAVVCFGDTNIVAGVQIRTRPVIYVTMDANTTNTLWYREALTDEWEMSFFLHDHVTGTNRQRMIVESSDWDENDPTGFFWLQVDGVNYTNVSVDAVLVVTPSIPNGD